MPQQFLQVLQRQTPGQMNNGIVEFKNEAKNITEYFSELNYQEDIHGSPAIVGELLLKDVTGDLIDSYSIKIVATNNYPYRFPWVYETGKRIPISIDWHVFPDGHCCVKAIPEELLICKKGITLPGFIKEQVIPNFFNQKYREQHGFFLHERAHGEFGNIEFFKELFNTSDLNVIQKFLSIAKSRKELKGEDKCICGSSKKYKKCHRREFRKITLYSQDELDYFNSWFH